MAQDAPVQDRPVNDHHGDEQAVESAGPASVYDLIAAIAEPTIELSWQKLGLRPDLRTGRIEPDLEQAKVAIDLVAHLVDVIKPQLDDEDRRQMGNVVRDLRLNYVSRANAGGDQA